MRRLYSRQATDGLSPAASVLMTTLPMGAKPHSAAISAGDPVNARFCRGLWRGFKAPTLFQLFSFYGNTTLNPETAKSYEIGLEQNLLERP